jgi:RNA polymerase sigma-70 factor (ECF subfamily)
LCDFHQNREITGERKMDHHVQHSQRVNLSHTPADQMLMEQALAGDQAAFEVLMNKYERPLRGYMRRILKDQELIADVLQHVFFQFYVSLPNLRTTSPLKPWLYRVAYNRCVDELRKNARRQALSFSFLEGQESAEEQALVEMLPDTHLTPEELFERQELHEQLVQAIRTLSPTFRTVVHLRCFGELSFSEIGQQLQMPEGTAKTYFYRSLPQLRAALGARRDERSAQTIR